MGLEHTVTLLESRHYDRSQIISSIEKKSKLEKLIQTKGVLNHLIEEVSQKLEQRKIRQREDISSIPDNSIIPRLKRWYEFRFLKSETKSIGWEGVQTVGESFNQTVERLNYESRVASMRQIIDSDTKNVKKSLRFKCWNISHEKNGFNLSRKGYFDYFKNQNTRSLRFLFVTIVFSWFVVNSFAVDFNAPYYAPTLLIVSFWLISFWVLICTPLTIRYYRKKDFTRNMFYEIESSFGQSYTELDEELKNIRHLSLGQFFQPGDYLFRLVGYVNGSESHVLMLRKRMRGSSSIVPDYIDRFSQAALVAINVEEFVDLYTGKDLEKDDHAWSTRIIKPNENWND